MGWSTNCLSWNNNENKEHAIPGGILLPRLAFDLYNILGQSAGILRNQIIHCVFLSFFFHFSHLLENVIKIQVVSLDLYQRLQMPLISSACAICAWLPHLIVWLLLAVRVEKLTVALLFKELLLSSSQSFILNMSFPHYTSSLRSPCQAQTNSACVYETNRKKKKKNFGKKLHKVGISIPESQLKGPKET